MAKRINSAVGLILALLLTSIGCGGEGSTPSGSAPDRIARVQGYTSFLAPDSLFQLSTSLPAGLLEVRVDGRLVTHVFETRVSDLYLLPEGLPPGQRQLTVRQVDSPSIDDSVMLNITQPLFVDVAGSVGLTNQHDYKGALSDGACWQFSTGQAWGDVDGDGDLDFYVGNLASGGRLFRNDGDQDSDGLPDFTDVSIAFGADGVDEVAAASFVDYDNDGDQDLWIGRKGPDVLLRNRLIEDGSPGFEDISTAAGIAAHAMQRSMGAGWGDYDNDGDLDLYVTVHSWCDSNKNNLHPADHLYRNDDGTFVEVSDLLGGDGPELRGLGFAAVWIDYDRDGDQDLFVVNDHIDDQISRPNVLWRNDGVGAQPGEWLFTDVSTSSAFGLEADSVKEGINGMGVDFGDVNRDGRPDVAFSNILPNMLLHGSSGGGFTDVSVSAGIDRPILPWGHRNYTWGTHLFDADNDGDLDLFYAGSEVSLVAPPVPNAFFLNNDDGTFTEQTWQAGLANQYASKGSAIVDLDRDGFLEFAVHNYAGPLQIFRNRSAELGNTNNWLWVGLEGQGAADKTNRDGIGGIVEVETPDGEIQTCWHVIRPGFAGGGEVGCHFGLGSNTSITRLTIIWPTGVVEMPMPPPAIDRRVTYVEP